MPRLRPYSVFVLAALAAAPLAAQSNADRARAFQGAWLHVETSNPRTFQMLADQPGMRLFVDGHYADVHVNGTRARSQVDSTSTALQLWNTFGRGLTAQAGAYSVAGDTLVTRASVAKSPNAMAPGVFTRFSYRMSGDSLWLTAIANQAGPITSISTSLWVRQRQPAMPTN